ncbi:hypothetical protein T484DRAFT_1920652, partial [Baffinella frigidus]
MRLGALAVAVALLACTDAFTVPAGFSPALLRSRSPQLCPVRSRGSTAEGKFLPALVQPSARRRESSRVGENMVIGVVSVLTGPVVALAALGTLDGLGEFCGTSRGLEVATDGGLEAVTDVDKLKQGILDSPEYRYNVLKLFVKYDVDGDGKALHVRTAWLDEKASAVRCMGALAEGMKGDFAPHLEAAVACVNKLEGYFHEDVRQGVQAALQKLLMVSFEAHTAPLRAQAAAAGQDASAILHPTTALLLDDVMEELIGTMQHDDDKETVAQACEAIALLSKPLGAPALSKVMVRIVEALKMLLEGGAPCQAEDEEADQEGGGGG